MNRPERIQMLCDLACLADSPDAAVTVLCEAVALACIVTGTDPSAAAERMIEGGEALLRAQAVVRPEQRRRALHVVA